MMSIPIEVIKCVIQFLPSDQRNRVYKQGVAGCRARKAISWEVGLRLRERYPAINNVQQISSLRPTDIRWLRWHGALASCNSIKSIKEYRGTFGELVRVFSEPLRTKYSRKSEVSVFQEGRLVSRCTSEGIVEHLLCSSSRELVMFAFFSNMSHATRSWQCRAVNLVDGSRSESFRAGGPFTVSTHVLHYPGLGVVLFNRYGDTTSIYNAQGRVVAKLRPVFKSYLPFSFGKRACLLTWSFDDAHWSNLTGQVYEFVREGSGALYTPRQLLDQIVPCNLVSDRSIKWRLSLWPRAEKSGEGWVNFSAEVMGRGYPRRAPLQPGQLPDLSVADRVEFPRTVFKFVLKWLGQKENGDPKLAFQLPSERKRKRCDENVPGAKRVKL